MMYQELEPVRRRRAFGLQRRQELVDIRELRLCRA